MQKRSNPKVTTWAKRRIYRRPERSKCSVQGGRLRGSCTQRLVCLYRLSCDSICRKRSIQVCMYYKHGNRIDRRVGLWTGFVGMSCQRGSCKWCELDISIARTGLWWYLCLEEELQRDLVVYSKGLFLCVCSSVG